MPLSGVQNLIKSLGTLVYGLIDVLQLKKIWDSFPNKRIEIIKALLFWFIIKPFSFIKLTIYIRRWFKSSIYRQFQIDIL